MSVFKTANSMKIIWLYISIALMTPYCIAQENNIYTYSDNDVDAIEIWFFPKEKAHWDGSKITTKEWNMLTDFQKATFISEYFEELEKKQNKSIEIDGWRWLIALNAFVNNYGENAPMLMTEVIDDLLKQ